MHQQKANTMVSQQPLDLVIIGASAAGVSAAIYAARRNLRFVILTGDIGGEVASSGEIENYLGFKHTDGIELTQKFVEQLDYYKVTVEQPVRVTGVSKTGNAFTISGKRDGTTQTWKAKAVIITSGIHPRALSVPEEEKLKGRGLSYCTTCDGPLFKGKVTATIGGGNSALESLLMLAEISPKVYAINKNEDFKGDGMLIEKVKAKKNITIIANALTTHVLGDTRVQGIEYQDQDGTTKRLDDIQGVFVHIGMLPNSDLVLPEIEKNKLGEIVVDKDCSTAVPGLYAAGDVTDVPYKQIAIAAGQGALAALSAVSYLNTLKD